MDRPLRPTVGGIRYHRIDAGRPGKRLDAEIGRKIARVAYTLRMLAQTRPAPFWNGVRDVSEVSSRRRCAEIFRGHRSRHGV